MLAGDIGQLVFQAGFEDVFVPAGEFRLFQSVSGLTATGAAVEVQNNNPAVGPASQGTNLLELDGTNGVFVTITDVPADGLILQGDYSPRRGFNAAQNTIQVLWNGTVVSTLARDGRGQSSTDFQQFQISLSGENASGRLEFRSISPNDTFGAGGLLDAIRVYTVEDSNDLAPVFEEIQDQSINELEPISIQLSATDGDSAQDQLRYEALRSPVGSTLDPETGLFTWTPNSAAGTRTFGIDVQVTDQTGLSDVQTFRISVADVEVSSAPVFVQVEDQSINELEPISIQLVANDSDSAQNQLRYEALRSPAGSTLDPVTGLFTWTPNSAAGTRTFGIDVQVTDQTGLSDVQTFRITVADIEGGAAPVFVQVNDQSINELEPISIQLVANDSDSAQNQLRYEALRSPVGSTLDPVTGLFTWTPNSAAGTRTFGIDVQVTDQTGLSDVQTFRITVADLDVSGAPAFVQIDDQSINELEPISIQLVANDSDSAQDQLRYEALRSPVGSTLDPVTGLFTWTPNSAAGTRTFGIDVQVTDQTGLSDVQTFRITVADIEGGAAPVFVQVDDQSINELEPISIQLVANDSDSAQSELRYEALRSPIGSTLDPVTGLFTWTPNSAAGTRLFGIDVQVIDQTGLSDVQTFRITVADVPQGEAPVFVQVEDRTINELESVSIQLVATDSDSSQDQLRYTALRSPVGSVLDPLTGVFTWTPNSAAGTRTFGIDVQVTDETGASDTQTFRIEVLDNSDNIDDIVLIETQEFETSATRSLTIDESTNELAFDFATIFDQGDTDFINDAFEVALLDSEGNSLVHTIDANRDAFFNVTEGEAAAGGVNTVVMGQTVRLDLSHIAEGTSADLVFRLVNNDDDTNTQVTISSIETSDNQLNTPVGAALGAAVAGPTAPIDFARLSDVTGSLEVNFGQTSFNDADDALYSRIELTNVGQVAIAGRILAVLENPTDVQVALLQPDGRLPDGRFFIEVNPEDGQLEAGDTTTSRDLVLQNPSEEQFDFDLTILAEVNNAPNRIHINSSIDRRSWKYAHLHGCCHRSRRRASTAIQHRARQ